MVIVQGYRFGLSHIVLAENTSSCIKRGGACKRPNRLEKRRKKKVEIISK